MSKEMIDLLIDNIKKDVYLIDSFLDNTSIIKFDISFLVIIFLSSFDHYYKPNIRYNLLD